MKKLFLLLALAGVMVACGDEKKKDEKKADNTEAPAPTAGEQKDATEAPKNDECCGKCEQECNKECGEVCTGECGEEKCCGECDNVEVAEAPEAGDENVAPAATPNNALVQKAVEAIINNDEAAMMAVEAEFEKLSLEEQAAFEAAVEEAVMALLS